MAEKILVVDDDPTLLQLIETSLKQDHYEVIVASNGEEGMRLLGELKAHLIILDIMMPGKTGMEVCNLLRQQPAFKNTLIIFLIITRL